MCVTDRAIGELLRTEVLQPRIVMRAVDLAVALFTREQSDGSRVARLTKQLAGLDTALANLEDPGCVLVPRRVRQPYIIWSFQHVVGFRRMPTNA